MTPRDRTDLLRLGRLAAPTPSDGELHRHYAERRDEAAGRRVLGSTHEAEDLCQAAFVTHPAVGENGLVIVLDRSTPFEGVVRGPDGRLAAEDVAPAV